MAFFVFALVLDFGWLVFSGKCHVVGGVSLPSALARAGDVRALLVQSMDKSFFSAVGLVGVVEVAILVFAQSGFALFSGGRCLACSVATS